MKKLSMFAGVATMLALGACKDEEGGEMTRAPGEPQVVRQDYPSPPMQREGVATGVEEEPRVAMEAQGPEIEAQGPQAFSIDVDPMIVERCEGVETTRTFFDTDQAQVSEGDKRLLRDIAECMTTGELQGQSVAIIGFADPRGPFDYNYDLGRRRAQSVESFLAQAGLQRNRMETLSVGEALSSPMDEQSLRFERRVTIRLVQEEAIGGQGQQQQRQQQEQQGQEQEQAQEEQAQEEQAQEEQAQEEQQRQQQEEQQRQQQEEQQRQQQEQQEEQQRQQQGEQGTEEDLDVDVDIDYDEPGAAE